MLLVLTILPFIILYTLLATDYIVLIFVLIAIEQIILIKIKTIPNGIPIANVIDSIQNNSLNPYHNNTIDYYDNNIVIGKLL